MNPRLEAAGQPKINQALERIAEKMGTDLQAVDLAGEQAAFASIEEAASKIGQAVTRHVMEDLATQQPLLFEEAQPCPTCQKRCDVKVRPRRSRTAKGPSSVPKTVCHCSACRRDAFQLNAPA